MTFVLIRRDYDTQSDTRDVRAQGREPHEDITTRRPSASLRRNPYLDLVLLASRTVRQ